MPKEIFILSLTAASIGFLHTLLGPDHYIPFMMLSRARQWSFYKTALVTFLCGLAHVGSSILLGTIGMAAGLTLFRLEKIESMRGDIAGWLLLAFGAGYFVWGLVRAVRNTPHAHWHVHSDGERHLHIHDHQNKDHEHRHEEEGKGRATSWILFTIFVFGPCEPLIPLLVPAAKHSLAGVAWVSGIFSLTTIVTMVTLVLLASYGLNLLRLGKWERYIHAASGALIVLCAAAILFLGW